MKVASYCLSQTCSLFENGSRAVGDGARGARPEDAEIFIGIDHMSRVSKTAVWRKT